MPRDGRLAMKTYVVVQRRGGEVRIVGVFLTRSKADEVAGELCGDCRVEKHVAVK